MEREWEKTKGNNKKTESKKASELTERRRHRTGKSKQYGTGTSRGTRTGPKLTVVVTVSTETFDRMIRE